jgi:hypothetical protein
LPDGTREIFGFHEFVKAELTGRSASRQTSLKSQANFRSIAPRAAIAAGECSDAANLINLICLRRQQTAFAVCGPA